MPKIPRMVAHDDAESARARMLVTELERRGQQSRYARFLAKPRSPGEALDALTDELYAEMASSLGRAERRLCNALIEVEALDQRLDDPATPADPRCDRAALLARRNEARSEAKIRLQNLKIQREACGFYRNQHLDEQYAIPPRRLA